MSAPLSICAFLNAEPLAEAALQVLSGDRYLLTLFQSTKEFFNFVDREKQHIDCLVLQSSASLPALTNWLYGQAVLLPAIIILPEPGTTNESIPPCHESDLSFTYHTAEVCITQAQIDQLSHSIDRAIAEFLSLSPIPRHSKAASTTDPHTDLTAQNFLKLQQRRLIEKLKERLGYLGVYYKRNPQNFFRHLSSTEKQELLDQLKSSYRDIVLLYFANDDSLNQRIDEFVNTVFFTDIPVSQVVEIHMSLMDEFAKQLKLEGRSEEILLDYRLTLIDTIAHLCEMYRRSIPRES